MDVNILQDLLVYVSSKHAYLQTLPKRQPQTLNNIQHVLLDQLQPDTLVHSIIKIVNITELTGQLTFLICYSFTEYVLQNVCAGVERGRMGLEWLRRHFKVCLAIHLETQGLNLKKILLPTPPSCLI